MAWPWPVGDCTFQRHSCLRRGGVKVEFLESKYAERSASGGIFAKISDTVEDTMRAGKLPIQAISGTMGLMDSAAKVARGLVAAGESVVDEAVKAASGQSKIPNSAEPKVVEPKEDRAER